MTLEEATGVLIRFRDQLAAMGFDDETIAEATRLGGNQIPVFGTQLNGCYIRSNGERNAHYATPGWYFIRAVEGKRVVILKNVETADPFEFYADFLLAVLDANLEYVARGLQP